jgi:hypothetical protein
MTGDKVQPNRKPWAREVDEADRVPHGGDKTDRGATVAYQLRALEIGEHRIRPSVQRLQRLDVDGFGG